MIVITKKICIEKECENESLTESKLCYLHNCIIEPMVFKDKQVYEIVYEHEYNHIGFNVLTKFQCKSYGNFNFNKSWINDNTYTYMYTL